MEHQAQPVPLASIGEIRVGYVAGAVAGLGLLAAECIAGFGIVKLAVFAAKQIAIRL